MFNLASGRLRPLLIILLSTGFVVSFAPQALATNSSEETNFLAMDMEDLLQLDVSIASKKLESQDDAPGVVSSVQRDELLLFGDRNLGQLLQRQASVYTRGSYAYPSNIASFRGDMPTHLDQHTLLLLNGRPIHNSAFGGVNSPVYTALPLAGVQKVELVRGPGSVLYGTNAFSGVVNVVTSTPTDDHNFMTSVTGGSFGSFEANLLASGCTEDLGYTTVLRYAGQRGYNFSAYDDTGAYGSSHDNQRLFSGMASLNYKQFTLDVFAARCQLFQMGPIPRWDVPEHKFYANNLFANLGYKTALKNICDLELNLTFNMQDTDFARYPLGEVDVNSADLLAEATIRTRPVKNLNVILGYLAKYQSSVGSNDGGFESIRPYDHSPQSAYSQVDYSVGNWAKLIGGAQWNETASKTTDWVTRMGLIVKPAPNWSLKLLKGEAFRAPAGIETDVYDLPVLVGNPSLIPEEITTTDLQVSYSNGNSFVAVTYFHSDLDNPIVRDIDVSPVSFKNAGRIEFDGYELEFKQSINHNWYLLGSALIYDNRVTADLQPSLAPETMAKMGLAYTWNLGNAAIFISHFSDTETRPTATEVNPDPESQNLVSTQLKLDPAAFMNVEASRVTITLRGENLLNEQVYLPEFNRGGNPNTLPGGPGFTGYFSISYNF